jgi:hypothetical protein
MITKRIAAIAAATLITATTLPSGLAAASTHAPARNVTHSISAPRHDTANSKIKPDAGSGCTQVFTDTEDTAADALAVVQEEANYGPCQAKGPGTAKQNSDGTWTARVGAFCC